MWGRGNEESFSNTIGLYGKTHKSQSSLFTCFQEVIDDKDAKVGTVDTLVFCSGKFYYELKEKAAEMGVDNLAFVRVEQLYPLPTNQNYVGN